MNEEKPFAESSEAGISRRKMLKRVGAGMAIAWTAPVLTSMRTPAFAATATCAPFDCLGQPRCGVTPGCPTNPPGCTLGGCAELNDNSCVCFDTGFAAVCANDADCVAQFGAGYRCGPVTNCAVATGCILPCGASRAAPKRQGRPLIRR